MGKIKRKLKNKTAPKKSSGRPRGPAKTTTGKRKPAKGSDSDDDKPAAKKRTTAAKQVRQEDIVEDDDEEIVAPKVKKEPFADDSMPSFYEELQGAAGFGEDEE
jgi:hypothetical protein